MNAPQVGKVGDLVAGLEDKVLNFTSVALSGGVCYQGINLIGGQSVHLAQLADYRLAPEGVDGAKECRVTVAVAAEDVLGYGVALFPGVVYVKVGRRASFRIDEPLEVKVQVNGINISDFQTVSNNGISSAAASHMVKSTGH